jgi:hypothetical protein
VGLSSYLVPGHRDVQEKIIVIIGTAWNAKGGAVVLTKKDAVYYVRGLEAWDKKFYGKKVKVTGKLVLVDHPKRRKDEPLVQEMEGTQRIIEDAKWELVK